MKKPRTCVKCQAIGDGYKFAPASQKNMCAACYSEYKTTKHLAAEAQRNKVCKRCGKAFYNKDKRQVVCSLKCDGAAELVACAACGKQCRRSKKREHQNAACSPDCQQMLLQMGAAKKAAMAQKRRNEERQQIAKKKWKAIRHKERRHANQWVQTAIRERRRMLESTETHDDAWIRRCNAAATGLSIRQKRRKDKCKNIGNGKTQTLMQKASAATAKWRRQQKIGTWQARCENAINLQRKREQQFIN